MKIRFNTLTKSIKSNHNSMRSQRSVFFYLAFSYLLFSILPNQVQGQSMNLPDKNKMQPYTNLNLYPELEKLITQNDLTACVYIVKADYTDSLVVNADRVDSMFLPASTFKIPNTLIALEEKAIKGLYDTIKWDGVTRSVDEWNHDQTLKSAFKYSCVWFYQELARRIGLEKYSIWLKKLNYGNEIAGPGVDDFWLQGDIKISAREQVTFLRKVYYREYPFSSDHYNILNRAMLVDSTADYKLFAKTGWAARLEKQVGWYVGYVESQGKVWFFAANLTINKEEEIVFRRELIIKALKDLKII